MILLLIDYFIDAIFKSHHVHCNPTFTVTGGGFSTAHKFSSASHSSQSRVVELFSPESKAALQFVPQAISIHLLTLVLYTHSDYLNNLNLIMSPIIWEPV